MRLLVKAAMVPLWSSGFIVGTLAIEHTQPLPLMFWRFVAAAAVMALIAVAMRARWPLERRTLGAVAAVGVLLQALQFTGIFLGFAYGVPAGLAALLAGSSPVAVAIVERAAFGERLRPRQWLGSAVAVAGVALATAAELGGRTTVAGLLFALLGFAGLVGGTVVQRRYVGAVDARSANAVQLAVAAVVALPVVAFTQGLQLDTGTATLAPLAWLVLGNSILAVLLYFWLLRQEKGGEATSFLYLVPSVTALAAVPTLGQPLAPGAIAGLVLALAGTVMVNARGRVDEPSPEKEEAPMLPTTVQEVMTPDPVTIEASSPVGYAAKAMRDHDVGAVVVTNGDELRGIVTDRDIVVRALADGPDPMDVRVDEVATQRDLRTLQPQDPIDDAALAMREAAVRRLPVVEDGRVVGIVSLGDLAIERDPRSALADISSAPDRR
jgi:drug/metabolite transporter (DMT)-like permease/CBS domain-containing protein